MNCRAKDARKFLTKHKRLDLAVDAYYTSPAASKAPASTSKLNALFDKYKGAVLVLLSLSTRARHSCGFAMSLVVVSHRCPGRFRVHTEPDGDDISVDGTIKLCEDLDVDPEDVVLLAVAYELKSPSMGQWSRKGWVDGWKALG